jgi:hypothetical protein
MKLNRAVGTLTLRLGSRLLLVRANDQSKHLHVMLTQLSEYVVK